MRTRIARAAILSSTILIPFASRSDLRSDDARAQPKVVAISGVSVRATDDAGVIMRAAAYDSLIETLVRGQGFAVVPHDTSNALTARITDSLGGIFDPVTGARDTARIRIIDDSIRAALHKRYDADLWLQPFIIVEGVSFYGSEAKWRGTSEKTGAAGGVGGALLGTKKGTIPALSLLVFVEDTTGRTVYRGSGGIQLAMKAGGFGEKPKNVPMYDLLADRMRNERAVHLALDSLAVRVGVLRNLTTQTDR